MSPRIYREFKNLELIDVSQFKNEKAPLKIYNAEEIKEIVFTDIDDKFSHKTIFINASPDYRNVVGFFTTVILKESRLFSGFDILYPKVENFIQKYLFRRAVDIADAQTLRNLSELQPKEILKATFKKAIDELTITDKGSAEVKNFISLRDTKPKIAENQRYITPKKSVFNKIITDNDFELELAAKFENIFSDVTAFAKNTMGDGGVNFKIEYQAENGNLREYYPDFFVKTKPNEIFIVETKGREDLDDVRKIKRLVTWCNDVNAAQSQYCYTPIYIKQEKWTEVKQDIKNFADLCTIFTAT